MPKDQTPSRALLQKEYRALENFAIDPKLEKILTAASQDKAAVAKLKADPRKFLADKRLRLPEDLKISITVVRFRICIWICRVVLGRWVVCVRYCFPIIIIR